MALDVRVIDGVRLAKAGLVYCYRAKWLLVSYWPLARSCGSRERHTGRRAASGGQKTRHVLSLNDAAKASQLYAAAERPETSAAAASPGRK